MYIVGKDKNLVANEEIADYEVISKAHFLNENAKPVNQSLGDLTELTGIGFHIIEIEPGYESTELHRHHHEDECVYILDGEDNFPNSSQANSCRIYIETTTGY